jgi:hypothetical protein
MPNAGEPTKFNGVDVLGAVLLTGVHLATN